MEKQILQHAEKNQQKAYDIINELRIIDIWEQYGAKANLIGSLKTGLLLKNLDIDFHIYSERFSIKDSFGAIAEIANNPKIKKVTYDNLLDTEEMCLEWHAWYEDTENNLWQIDMIHILNDSPYAGKMEEVAERINKVLYPELKYIILNIKNCIPENEKIPGIFIYQAVIQDGIDNYNDFFNWMKNKPKEIIVDWIP